MSEDMGRGGACRRSSGESREAGKFIHESMPVWLCVYKQRMHKTLIIELGKDKSTKGFKDFGKECGSYSKGDRNITISIRQKNRRTWF